MSRAPGLLPALRNLKAFREPPQLLEDVFYLEPLFHAVSYTFSENFLMLTLYDEH